MGRVALEVLHVDEHTRFALFKADTGSADRDTIEAAAWSFLPDSENLLRKNWSCVESFVHRGPRWRTPSGTIVEPGDWCVGVRMEPVAWQRFTKSGYVPPKLLKAVATTATTGAKPISDIVKGMQEMGKKNSAEKTASINLAGSGSGSAGQLGNSAYARLLAASQGQTKLNNPRADSVFKAFDEAVADARTRLEKAANEFDRMRAQGDLKNALRQRFLLKMVVADNARQNGTLPPAKFGPGSAALFGEGERCSTYSLGEDSGLRYAGVPGRR